MYCKKKKIFEAASRFLKSLFGWKAIYILLAGADMMVCVPYTSYQVVKVMDNKTWQENHSHLMNLVQGHAIALIVLGIFAVCFVMAIPRFQTLMTLANRIAQIVFLYIVTDGVELTGGKLIMKWAVIYFGMQHLILCVVSLPMTKELKGPVADAIYRIWTPAIGCIGVIMPSVYIILPKKIYMEIPIAPFIGYTFGMEVIMAATYFITIYDAFCSVDLKSMADKKKSSRDEEFLLNEEETDDSQLEQISSITE